MRTRKLALSGLIYAGVCLGGAISGFALGQTPTGGPDAGISEAAIPGAGVGQFSADLATGQFDQTFTATGPTNFLAEGIFNAGTWNLDGSAVSSQLGGVVPVGYDLYAKFAEAGTFASTGTGFTYTPGSMYVELWADPSQNTTYHVGTTATGNVNNLQLFSGAASVTDDILLASAAVLLSGSGSATQGAANGLFHSTLSGLTLTPAGAQYFATPSTFYPELLFGGNFQSFVPVSGTSVQLLNNTGGIAFADTAATPEPATLALLFVGIAGIGFARRRAR